MIGAGFAGLSAATALAERGVRVTVLEARPAAGGRATAFTDPATGERVDNGQHVLIGGYHETFRFLRRIGTAEQVHLQDNLAVDFVDRRGRWSTLACPPLPPPLHLAAGVLRWRALGWRDRLAVLRMRSAVGGAAEAGHYDGSRDDVRSVRLQANRDITVREWLVAHGQTPRLIDMLWEPLAVAALNESIDTAAAAPFAAVLSSMFTRDRRDSALGLPLVPLDELFALPAARYVQARGGTVRTSALARIHVASRPGGEAPGRGSPPPFTVRVRGEEVRADAVICAAAWYSLPEIFEGDVEPLRAALDAAAGTGASPIVTVNLWFDRPVTSSTFVGLPGRAMQWVFDKRTLFGAHASHLSLVSSGASALAGMSNAELTDLAMAELAEAVPAVRAASLRRAVVVRERRASFSVAPGQPARPGVRTAVPSLFLAGDWIDTGLPATIESACVSGHAAADAVLTCLSR